LGDLIRVFGAVTATAIALRLIIFPILRSPASYDHGRDTGMHPASPQVYDTAATTEPAGERRSAVPLYMDHHKHVEGLTADAVADAHANDLEAQGKYGVNYIKYWFNEEKGEVFCLVEAPNAEAADAVHKEAHGLGADEITEVKEGS
jgi:hypothetical protein